MAGDWFEDAGAGELAPVQAMLDSISVTASIADLVKQGCLVSLGLTSDGGALGVTVMFDDRKRREWFRDVAELEGWLQDAVTGVTDLILTSTPASGARRRRRR